MEPPTAPTTDADLAREPIPEPGDDGATAALRELILAGEAYRTSVARTMGISTTESQALSYLLARGPMGQTDLANALGLTTSSTTSVIDRLESASLVHRVAHASDRRRSTVHLSDTADERLASPRTWITQAILALPPSHRDHLSQDLLTLASALRRASRQ